MDQPVSSSIKYGAVLLAVAGTAAGLNLSVMTLDNQASVEALESTSAAAAPSTEPEILRVVVDVPVLEQPTSADSVVVANETGQAATAATQASRPAPSPSPQPAPAPSQPPTTAAPTTAPATSADSATTTAAPVTTSQTPASSAPVTEYLTYEFEGVADLVIAYHQGQSLEFWSVTPEDGWAYQVEKNRPDHVEVKFRRVSGSEGEAKFELIQKNGELIVKKER